MLAHHALHGRASTHAALVTLRVLLALAGPLLLHAAATPALTFSADLPPTLSHVFPSLCAPLEQTPVSFHYRDAAAAGKVLKPSARAMDVVLAHSVEPLGGLESTIIEIQNLMKGLNRPKPFVIVVSKVGAAAA